MSSTRWAFAVILASTLSGGAANAADRPATNGSHEARQEILLDALRANRKAFVAVNLDLTPREAGEFWPLYDRYQKEIEAIGDRVVAILGDYTASFRDLSDEKALKLMQDYLAAEAERVQVRRTYLPEFAKLLGGRKATRLYQTENKMDALLRYELAASIPVVEEPGTEAATPGP